MGLDLKKSRMLLEAGLAEELFKYKRSLDKVENIIS